MTASSETIATFYEDFYRKELDVWVDALVAHGRFGPCLVLSETLCHPHGGGQKGDRAVLAPTGAAATALGAKALPLVDTRREEGRILHVLEAEENRGALDAPQLAALEEALVGTQPFTLRLDWDFRHRQMRLHSAAHLLHCFIEQVLGAEQAFPETSDLQPDFGLNRYDRKELLTTAQMEQVLAGLNAFTAEGHPITTTPDPERAGIRHWQCGEWRIPCGGTHPRDTGEIGDIEASLSLKRGRTSMTFRLKSD